MGVYVPTRFPRNCGDCSELCLADVMECYPDEYGEDSDGNKIVCPLTEIVQCKDCKYGHKHILKDTYDCDKSDITVFHEADFFCKASERRE